jgi:hypothetical protein
MTLLHNRLAGILLILVAEAAAFIWLDRPIAVFSHSYLQRFGIFQQITHIPELLAPAAVVIFAAIAVRAFVSRSLSKLETVVALSVAALASAELANDILKKAFGRTWPETWMGTRHSFATAFTASIRFMAGPGTRRSHQGI